MGFQGTTKGMKTEHVGQVEKPYQVVREIYEFPSGQHLSIRIQDGITRNSWRDGNENVWQVEKPYHLVIEFHELPSGHQFFPLVPRMGSQETITGTKTENVWQANRTLSSFYWIWWDAIRTSVFPLGPRMGSQGTTQGTWTGNVWQVKQPGRVFIECDEVSSGHNFFHAGPGWDPKGRPKGWKQKMSDR